MQECNASFGDNNILLSNFTLRKYQESLSAEIRKQLRKSEGWAEKFFL